ncbi:MAG: pyridoxal phosphate-dependent aminotransferase [Deltaproteobacteria bacterium]|nr:pyridoxal phosphate-dependent aminotransferase [Deltaproteobacteria bacterium]MBW2308067.1 pyridoxal phosphate-dependent aminotransferase [Deltaproteobacteria bacterium]
MAIAEKIERFMERASWIRKMFEEGARLKARYGAENVYDFSLGNPNLEPPSKFREVLQELARDETPAQHGYMPNAGLPWVRKTVARTISAEQGVELSDNHVIMTCGAGGALNVILKTLLNPGDQVIVPAPYFVEYDFYADNHGGSILAVPSREDFTLDIDAIASAINDRTRAVLINSPNNPTGAVYSAAEIKALAEVLQGENRRRKQAVYLISDEPYRRIVYDGLKVPPVFSAYEHTVIASSYSKELSLAGERIGYIALHPAAEDAGKLMAGMVMCNRILGFVNAPALMQRTVARLQGMAVNVDAYRRKRDMLCQGLAAAGYSFTRPKGAFYLFPRTPIDDLVFVRELQDKNILTVPGSGFGRSGHIRISYAVPSKTIERALPGFQEVGAKYFRR